MSGMFMDYGPEVVERRSEGRRLLKRVVFAVAYAIALWIAVATALEVTGGEVTSQTIPSPTSQPVYIEGACLAY